MFRPKESPKFTPKYLGLNFSLNSPKFIIKINVNTNSYKFRGG
jgi:hypothetical protein